MPNPSLILVSVRQEFVNISFRTPGYYYFERFMHRHGNWQQKWELEGWIEQFLNDCQISNTIAIPTLSDWLKKPRASFSTNDKQNQNQ